MINERIIAAVIFLSAFSYQLNAQNPLKQGVYSLAGAVSFSTAKNQGEHDKLNYTNFSFEPSFNYFVLDNLMIGDLLVTNILKWNTFRNLDRTANRSIEVSESVQPQDIISIRLQ